MEGGDNGGLMTFDFGGGKSKGKKPDFEARRKARMAKKKKKKGGPKGVKSKLGSKPWKKLKGFGGGGGDVIAVPKGGKTGFEVQVPKESPKPVDIAGGDVDVVVAKPKVSKPVESNDKGSKEKNIESKEPRTEAVDSQIKGPKIDDKVSNPQPKPSEDQPVKPLDEKPVGPAKDQKKEDEKEPEPPKKGYNLDNIAELERQFMEKQRQEKLAKERKLNGGKDPNPQPEAKTSAPAMTDKKAEATPNPKPTPEQPIGGSNPKPMGGGGGYDLSKLDGAFPSGSGAFPSGSGKIGGGGGYNLNSMAGAFPPGANMDPGAMKGAFPIGGDDEPIPLESRLKSSKLKEKLEAYDELMKWEDPTLTKQTFIKGLHLTIKERNPKAIAKLIKVMKVLFTAKDADSYLDKLDLKKFMLYYCENLMTNAKSGAVKKASLELIPILFKILPQNKIVEEIKTLLTVIKTKTQEKAIIFLIHLVRGGFIKELDYLNDFMNNFPKMTTSRTTGVRKGTMALLKEAFLWMGEPLLQMLTDLKENVLKELKEYAKTVDPSKMKLSKLPGGKAKKLDAYEMAREVVLPKEYLDSAWADKVIDMPKWNQKNSEIKALNAILSKAKKLHPKTETQSFIHLVRYFFGTSNINNQIEAIKMLGHLANGLRKNFAFQAKNMAPTLLKKLKEKKRQLTDAILDTMEIFYITLSLEETLEDIQENLKGKGSDKKNNILKLFIRLIKQGKGIKGPKLARKVVKMIIKLLEESDSEVRNKASEVIGKLKDKYNEAVTPLLSDLHPQRLKLILKHCRNQTGLVQEEEEALEKDKKPGSRRTKRKKLKTDKKTLIKELREELFSNKTVKLSDKSKFGSYLNMKLRALSSLTKDFTEISSGQLKEICLLVEELCQKIEKESFTDDNRKMVITFFLEQSNLKASNELFESMKNFIESKLISTKTFLIDTYDIIFRKNTKINKEFLIMLVRLLEKELVTHRNLGAIAHKQFVEFIKTHFSSPTTHVSIRLVIVNFMKTIEKKFGARHLSQYPANLLKELEQQNIENQKMLKKFLDKLNDRNNDRRRSAIEELINTRDPQRIKYYWSQMEFLNYLKRLLIQEKEEQIYSYLVEILEKYLDLYQNNSMEFSLKNYLYVFQIIINNYSNREDAGDMYIHIDKLFHKTVKSLSPNKVFYELMNDTNNASMREDILNFYLLFHEEITPKVSLIQWLTRIVNDKDAYTNELKSLVDNVLLTIKATDNDELVIKGAQNKHIRDVWRQREELIIFDPEILMRESIFDSVSKFRTIKRFLIRRLKLDEEEFYSKTIDRLLKEDLEDKRAKLVYYMIKAYNNTHQIAENIFADLQLIDWAEEDRMEILICIKILLTLLKNKIFEGESQFFSELRVFLMNVVKLVPDIETTFEETFSPNSFEYYFFNHLINTSKPVGFRHRFGENPGANHEAEEPVDPNLDTSAMQNGNNTSHIYQSTQVNQQVLGSQNGLGVNTSHFGGMASDMGSNHASYIGRKELGKSQKSFKIDLISADNRSTYGIFY